MLQNFIMYYIHNIVHIIYKQNIVHIIYKQTYVTYQTIIIS